MGPAGDKAAARGAKATIYGESLEMAMAPNRSEHKFAGSALDLTSRHKKGILT
jgi:hypothetical protein